MSSVEEQINSMSKVLCGTENSLAMESFKFREIRDCLEEVVQLGVINKSLDPDEKEDPRNDMADAIEESLEDLSEYMEFHSDDLSELKTDPTEYTKITETAMTLLSNLIYSLYEPGEFNIVLNSLLDETSAFDLGMKLLDLVENDSDFPMKTEFITEDGDVDTAKAYVFLKWRNIMEGFATQLLFIEAFSNGLYGDRKWEDAKTLKERIEGIVNEWSPEHEEKKEFQMEDIRSMVEAIQDNNPRKSCEEKAQMIQEELEKLDVGDDLFYILVFPTSDGYVYSANLPDQVLTSLNRGQCHVIVYRSRAAKNASKQDLKKMETQVTGYKALLRLLTLKLFVTKSQVDKWAQEIDNNGFVIALKASPKAAIRSTKTDVLKWGPGWWVYETLLLGILLPTKYIILAGFK